MNKRLLVSTTIFLFAVCSLTADVRGKIEGFVIDKEKNPLARVEVSIISLKSSAQQYNVRTNEKGKFTQIGIWPGFYQINLKKEGFQTLTTEERVGIAESTKLQFTLQSVEKAVEKTLSQADKHFVKGNKLYGEKKYEEAADAFEKAIKLNPENWGYFFNLGLAFKNIKNQEKAQISFLKALELNPESYGCNVEMGEALAKVGKHKEAKPYYQKAADKNPEEPDVFYNFGVVLINLGESAEALKAFEKAVQLNEDYPDALYQLGTLYVGQNRTEDAIRSFKRFLTLAPEHSKAHLARMLLDHLEK